VLLCCVWCWDDSDRASNLLEQQAQGLPAQNPGLGFLPQRQVGGAGDALYSTSMPRDKVVHRQLSVWYSVGLVCSIKYARANCHECEAQIQAGWRLLVANTPPGHVAGKTGCSA